MVNEIYIGIISGTIGGLIILIIQILLDYRKNSKEKKRRLIAGNISLKVLDKDFLYNYEPGRFGIEKVTEEFGQPFRRKKGADNDGKGLEFYEYNFKNAKLQFCIYENESSIIALTVFAYADKKYPVKCFQSFQDDLENFGTATITDSIIDNCISIEKFSSPRDANTLLVCRYFEYTPIRYLYFCYLVDGTFENATDAKNQIITQVCITQVESIRETFSFWDTFFG